MKIINDLFGNKKVNKIEKNGKVIIVDIDGNNYVIKEKTDVDIDYIYDYLSSRDFNYYPKKLFNNDNYNVYEYIENDKSPYEQKAYDLIEALSILHDKTAYYKSMDINEYKELFENISNKIDYTYNFYTKLILKIEQNMFMSPSNYLIARNISKIFQMLGYSKNNINIWYDMIRKNAKERIVTLHNNIDLNHVIRNKNLYLISFEKSKRGNPIYDLYEFYKKYNIFDFEELLKRYENKFSLLKEEKLLLYSLISIPDIVILDNNELNNCKKVKKIIDDLFKTEVLINKK